MQLHQKANNPLRFGRVLGSMCQRCHIADIEEDCLSLYVVNAMVAKMWISVGVVLMLP